jgi:outer membrane murein-binding lipoprotein Lpp
VNAWTESRLDDLAAAVRPLPGDVAQLSADVGRLSADVGATNIKLDALTAKVDGMARGIDRLAADQSAMQRQHAQIGWSVAGLAVAALFTLVITLLIALI